MSAPEKPAMAVALAYNHPGVPRVSASGRGSLAEKIVETARASGVPVEENPLLAEALSHVPLDEEIPVELYKAVAVVIGFVMRRQKALG